MSENHEHYDHHEHDHHEHDHHEHGHDHHEHDHGHDHHDHDHQNISAEALLKHMQEHNAHHLKELEEISGSLEGEAKASLAQAIDLYAKGNEKLAEAIGLIH